MKYFEKEGTEMEKQLKGIGLILFGILLILVSIAIEPFFGGGSYMIPCIAGGICGIAGIIKTLGNKEG